MERQRNSVERIKQFFFNRLTRRVYYVFLCYNLPHKIIHVYRYEDGETICEGVSVNEYALLRSTTSMHYVPSSTNVGVMSRMAQTINESQPSRFNDVYKFKDVDLELELDEKLKNVDLTECWNVVKKSATDYMKPLGVVVEGKFVFYDSAEGFGYGESAFRHEEVYLQKFR